MTPALRQPEDLREALIQASLGILNEPNTHLDMREVCRRVNRSQTAAYTVFGKEKDGGGRIALLAAVAAQGFERLAGRLQDAARATPENPTAVLESFGRTYLDFARSQPRIYRLMFGDALKGQLGFKDLVGARLSVQYLLQKAIANARHAGLVKGRTDLGHALHAWATLHGLAELLLDGQLDLLFEPAEAMTFVEDSIRILVASMKVKS
jgi:AcrR family transcriptional regulator